MTTVGQKVEIIPRTIKLSDHYAKTFLESLFPVMPIKRSFPCFALFARLQYHAVTNATGYVHWGGDGQALSTLSPSPCHAHIKSMAPYPVLLEFREAAT